MDRSKVTGGGGSEKFPPAENVLNCPGESGLKMLQFSMYFTVFLKNKPCNPKQHLQDNNVQVYTSSEKFLK